MVGKSPSPVPPSRSRRCPAPPAVPQPRTGRFAPVQGCQGEPAVEASRFGFQGRCALPGAGFPQKRPSGIGSLPNFGSGAVRRRLRQPPHPQGPPDLPARNEVRGPLEHGGQVADRPCRLLGRNDALLRRRRPFHNRGQPASRNILSTACATLATLPMARSPERRVTKTRGDASDGASPASWMKRGDKATAAAVCGMHNRPRKRPRGRPRGLRTACGEAPPHSLLCRTPMSCSRNWNRLMKFRYRPSASITLRLPASSVPAA